MKRYIVLILFIISNSYCDTLSYLNNIRLKCGASSLKFNKKLSYAAKKHAIYLSKNREFGHSENRYKNNFYASMPWERVAKAGFGSKAVIENISFGEKNYKDSINKIMATVYHRLAFLDTRIDSLGYARYKYVYVYDMSNSKIGNLCNKNYSSRDTKNIESICPNGKTVPLNLFNKTINSTKSHSKELIIYPYRNQKNVDISLADERPKFTYKNSCGLAISVTFNSYYYKNVKLKKFILKRANRVVTTKLVTFRNDIAKKLKKDTFVLLPLKKLKRATKYSVILSATANGKPIEYRWSFTTR